VKKIFSTIEAIVNWVTEKALLVSGIFIVIMAILDTYIVIRRYGFHKPDPYAMQINMWFLLFCIMMSFPALQKRRRNLRVDFVISKVPTKVQFIFEYVAVPICALGYVSFVIWKSFQFFMDSIEINEVSYSLLKEPLWPLKLLVTVCYAWLALGLLCQLVRGIQGIFSGVTPESYLIDLAEEQGVGLDPSVGEVAIEAAEAAEATLAEGADAALSDRTTTPDKG